MKFYSHQDHFIELKERQLTTVEILYHLPDYPDLLQTFIWQHMDSPPDFPRLKAFLNFWEENIDAKLFSVNIARIPLRETETARFAKGEFNFH